MPVRVRLREIRIPPNIGPGYMRKIPIKTYPASNTDTPYQAPVNDLFATYGKILSYIIALADLDPSGTRDPHLCRTRVSLERMQGILTPPPAGSPYFCARPRTHGPSTSDGLGPSRKLIAIECEARLVCMFDFWVFAFSAVC